MKPTPSASQPDNRPVFHSLFSVSGRDTPVSPIVSSLWGSPAVNTAQQQPKPTVLPEAPILAAAENPLPAPPPAAAPAAPPAPPSSGALDLFQEGATNARALFRGRV
jgi:hypothetical protein